MTHFNPDPRFRGPPQRQQVDRDHLEWEPIYPPYEPADEPARRARGAGWVVLGLVLLALLVGFFTLNHITAFLSTIGHIGPEWDDGEKAIGLMAFGIVLVSILAAMKIALNAGQGK